MKKKNRQTTVFVGICIKNKKILMTQRFEPECPDAHLKWELPGGKCDYGEIPAEGLKREFLEETGMEVKVGKLLLHIYTHYWKYKWGVQQTFVLAYICSFVKKLNKPRDAKIKDIQWIPLKDLKNYQLLGGTETILKTYFKSRN